MKNQPKSVGFYGAGDEARTRYLHLGKVALYRMSYTRIGTWIIIALFPDLSILFFSFFQNVRIPLNSKTENCNLSVRCMEPGIERRAQGSLWEGAFGVYRAV